MRFNLLWLLAILLFLGFAGSSFAPGFADDGAVQLTFGAVNDRYPDWSPDGTQIVFHSDRNGNNDLYIIPATGGVETQMTSDTLWDARAAWSPDGSMIAWESERNVDSAGAGYAKCELFVMPAAGGPITQVTDWDRYNERPDWSPDGSELVYATDYWLLQSTELAPDDGILHPADLYRIPVTGGTPIQITTNPGYENDAEWSPDGTTIAFSADYAGNWDIWTIPVSGGVATQITFDPLLDQDPSWSPDGSFLTFWSLRSGNADIWIIPATGGTPIQVTTSGSYDWGPSWSKDGAKIAFFSGRGPGVNIWVIDVPAAGVKQGNSTTWGWIKSMFD
jgi:Tol biopolymer transport system component